MKPTYYFNEEKKQHVIELSYEFDSEDAAQSLVKELEKITNYESANKRGSRFHIDLQESSSAPSDKLDSLWEGLEFKLIDSTIAPDLKKLTVKYECADIRFKKYAYPELINAIQMLLIQLKPTLGQVDETTYDGWTSVRLDHKRNLPTDATVITDYSLPEQSKKVEVPQHKPSISYLNKEYVLIDYGNSFEETNAEENIFIESLVAAGDPLYYDCSESEPQNNTDKNDTANREKFVLLRKPIPFLSKVQQWLTHNQKTLLIASAILLALIVTAVAAGIFIANPFIGAMVIGACVITATATLGVTAPLLQKPKWKRLAETGLTSTTDNQTAKNTKPTSWLNWIAGGLLILGTAGLAVLVGLTVLAVPTLIIATTITAALTIGFVGTLMAPTVIGWFSKKPKEDAVVIVEPVSPQRLGNFEPGIKPQFSMLGTPENTVVVAPVEIDNNSKSVTPARKYKPYSFLLMPPPPIDRHSANIDGDENKQIKKCNM